MGDEVAAGTLLGRVSNTLAERQHLDNLRIAEKATESRAAALANERASLEHLRRSMLSRAALHTTATRGRMAQQADEATALLAAKQTALQQANLELDRGQKLADWGGISRASLDKLVSTQRQTAQELRARQAALASAQTELMASQSGVLAEPGRNNDVAYSCQRADELAIKLAENLGEFEAARAQASQVTRDVDAKARRASLLGSSEVHAPSAGRVWRLYAINGEHLDADAPMLSLVDCSHPFVVAEVPQDRVSTIVLTAERRCGSPASQRRAGNGDERFRGLGRQPPG